MYLFGCQLKGTCVHFGLKLGMCFIFSGYENISPPPWQQLKVEETSASCCEKLK
jgi:hypothetical protein